MDSPPLKVKRLWNSCQPDMARCLPAWLSHGKLINTGLLQATADLRGLCTPAKCGVAGSAALLLKVMDGKGQASGVCTVVTCPALEALSLPLQAHLSQPPAKETCAATEKWICSPLLVC